jgi:hypothetical protein
MTEGGIKMSKNHYSEKIPSEEASIELKESEVKEDVIAKDLNEVKEVIEEKKEDTKSLETTKHSGTITLH